MHNKCFLKYIKNERLSMNAEETNKMNVDNYRLPQDLPIGKTYTVQLDIKDPDIKKGNPFENYQLDLLQKNFRKTSMTIMNTQPLNFRLLADTRNM